MNWQDVNAMAGNLAPLEDWRNELARGVRELAHCETVVVATCPPGDWTSLSVSAYPLDYSALWERGSLEFPSRMDEAGQGWRWAVQRFGSVYAPDRMLLNRRLAQDIRAKILAPTNLKGLATGYALEPHGNIVALIALAADRSSETLLNEHGFAVSRLCGLMGKTVSTAIEIATELGYVPAWRFRGISRLSPRERQIAQLAAEGYSTLNIGVRLGIAESTVGVHLKHVYRKLDVHSRVELLQRVLPWRDFP